MEYKKHAPVAREAQNELIAAYDKLRAAGSIRE